jgi:hypothetical protein
MKMKKWKKEDEDEVDEIDETDDKNGEANLQFITNIMIIKLSLSISS